MIHIIPEPKNMTIHQGAGSFPFSAETALVNSVLPQAAIADFQSFLRQNFHFTLTQPEGTTRLLLTRTEEGDPEAYRIEVSEQEICISSAGEAGLFYALQTLRQILLTNGCKIPSLSINDAPLYHYRGFMLDVGRYFYPVEDIKH